MKHFKITLPLSAPENKTPCLIALFCSTFIFLTACSEDTDTYSEVANTTIAAIQKPENFCNYVAQNMTVVSSGKYINCANEKINVFQARINKEIAKCEDIYKDYAGPLSQGYMLLKCEEDNNVGGMRTAMDLMHVFKSLGNGSASCSYINAFIYEAKIGWDDLRQSYIDLGLDEPYPSWSVSTSDMEPFYRESLSCKKVTKKFIGIKY